MKILVTRPSVPNLKKFNYYLKEIYKSRMLTTNGKLVKLLEKKLKKRLNVKYLILTCNGTIALEVALKALNIKKGVLTTPFSYVSTPNACKWLGIKTIFSDIETKTFSLDLKKIKKKIKQVDCIIPTHVFGIAENLEKMSLFSKKNKKKLIFDAAHCFGINYKKKNVLNYGDASILSFQATKIFNTCEGGAVIFNKRKEYDKAKLLVNIGYDYTKKISLPSLGINAKMSELNAAWGLALLDEYDKILIQKKKSFQLYKKYLRLRIINDGFQTNFNYMPILFSSETKRQRAIKDLNKKNYYPRKYFYPSLNTLKHLRDKKMPISESVSSRILCLPIYEYLNKSHIIKISDIVNKYV